MNNGQPQLIDFLERLGVHRRTAVAMTTVLLQGNRNDKSEICTRVLCSTATKCGLMRI